MILFTFLERRQNPKTLIQLQKFRNSKSHNTVNRKLANAQTVRFTGALFRFEFLKISSEWNAYFWILSLCKKSEISYKSGDLYILKKLRNYLSFRLNFFLNLNLTIENRKIKYKITKRHISPAR